MNNKKWLVFSFSFSARNQPARVKAWRRLNAIGAAHLKNSLYLLPFSPLHLEQLTWLAKEVEEQGGEATIISGGKLVNVAAAQAESIFTRARDADFSELEEEIRAFQAMGTTPEGATRSSLRKFSKRLETLRRIDFFPSGRGESLEKLLQGLNATGSPPAPRIPLRDVLDFQGQTWVTRPDPYVDRLASFWLVRRFVDTGARIEFAASPETHAGKPGVVRFDMSEADFTHQGGLITFEVMAQAFGLGDKIPARMLQLIHAIDLEEMDTAPAEAQGVKQLLDGLVKSCPGGHQRIEAAMTIFDTLMASYSSSSRRMT